MDGVCITFHVIANSSVRKSDKLKQNSAWWSRAQAAPEELGLAAHAFPQTQDTGGILEREETPFYAECCYLRNNCLNGV